MWASWLQRMRLRRVCCCWACQISQAFLHGAAGGLEVLPGGWLVAPLAGGFAFLLADDADVLRGLAEAGLILQLHGQLAGFHIPGPRLGQAAGLLFGHAEEIVGPHHRLEFARLLKALERLLVEAGGAVELVAIIGEAALMLEERSLQFLVPGLAGGGEGQVVAGIGLVVAARSHEDARRTGRDRRRLRGGCPASR